MGVSRTVPFEPSDFSVEAEAFGPPVSSLPRARPKRLSASRPRIPRPRSLNLGLGRSRLPGAAMR
jgi:hypothetical protein